MHNRVGVVTRSNTSHVVPTDPPLLTQVPYDEQATYDETSLRDNDDDSPYLVIIDQSRTLAE
jgi:hypothetical protein